METTNKSEFFSIKNNNLCRVCLSSDKENKCIFTFNCDKLHHEAYKLTNLVKQLQFYGGIEVSQDDGFPARICNECIWKMQVAHEFRTQCQTTDKILRSIDNNTANITYTTLNTFVEIKNETEQQYAECEEIKESENLSSNESSTDTQIDLSRSDYTLKKSDDTILSYSDSLQNDKLAVEAKVSQAHPIPVLKKINSNTDKKACKALKLPESQNNENKTLRPVFQEPDNDNFRDISNAKEDKTVLRKNEHRSRRVILFKRATSMTNLKDNKARQRQYIKKNLLPKIESSDRDDLRKNKNSRAKTRRSIVTDNNSLYNCSKCGRAYSNKSALESHQHSHNYQNFLCDQCDERFNRLDDFLKHAKTHNLSEKLMPASCKLCNKNFRKAVTMVRHLNIHKRENPRAVYAILKDIRDRKREKHVKISEGNRKNPEHFEDNIVIQDGQELCNDRLDSQDNPGHISELNNSESNPTENSETLNKIRSSKDKMEADESNNHIENYRHYKTNVNWEQSPPDERSAIKLINIWIKEELDSDNEGKGFPCENCTKSYATKKSLLKHQEKIHANTIVKFCPRCDGDCICTDKAEENHKKVQDKSFTCKVCDKTFENEVKLEKHMKIHTRAKEQEDTNFKRFLCHICSKTFRQNTGLMFHMRTHTGYKPHVCKYCGRGFTSNSNCINHERTHTGDRPFVCHYCSAAFAKSCTLKAHITTHTGEANYHCKTCGKSFRRLKYLKEHRFTHTGEKPYACKICGTAYSHSGSLFVHEKKCKAQDGNYQMISVPVNYHQQPLTEDVASSSITPIITTSSPSHHVRSIGEPLTVDMTKSYVENHPRINSLTNSVSENVGAHILMNPEAGDVTSADRSFDIAGQIFNT